MEERKKEPARDEGAPEIAVAVEGLHGVKLALAKNLLEAAGIPVLADGPDFDVAELGRAAHDQVRGRRLLVPLALLERARAVLEEAWGPLDAGNGPDGEG